MSESPQVPAEVFSPGALALEEMKARGWDDKELARRLMWPIGPVRRFLDGAYPVSIYAARDLARVFDISWAFWIRSEFRYRFPHATHNEVAGEEVWHG